MGRQMILIAPTSALGAELVVRTPMMGRWRLCAVAAQLTCDAISGNREPWLHVDDADGNTLLYLPVGGGGVMGELIRFCWGPTLALANWSFVVTGPLPKMELPRGAVIATTTFVLDVGDSWSHGVVVLEEIDSEIILAP